MGLAFFDLDKTLLAENSAKLWLVAQWKSRNINVWQMLQASYYLAKYHLGFTKMEHVIERSLLAFEGEKQSEVLEASREFFSTSIRHLYRPGALAAIQKHRDEGHKISLLTSTFAGLSSLVSEDLNFDYCLCTELEMDNDGTYTGKSLGPPCFGAHKVRAAKKLCQQLDIELGHCTFYTDSASDVPLLYLVGQPVAVNPDPHLRTRAQLNNWPIVDWGRPDAGY